MNPNNNNNNNNESHLMPTNPMDIMSSTPNMNIPNHPIDIQYNSIDSMNRNNFENEHYNMEESSSIDKEREMAELLITMDSYTPIIPDAVIDYYLNKTGFDCDDGRIKKLFALAAQKFVADIATDALQSNKVKHASRNASKSSKDKKTVLTMEDLSSALAENGVDIKKPEYYN